MQRIDSHVDDMRFSDVATLAARESAKVLRKMVSDGQGVARLKGVNDLVTDVDVAVQRMAARIILEHFPGHVIMGEEDDAPVDYDGRGPVWYIDPISSTVNFVHNLPHFAIAISFVHDGVTLAAVVYDVIVDELFMATRGRGAYLNGDPIYVSPVGEIEDAIAFVNVSLKSMRDVRGDFLALAPLFEKIGAYRRIGSTALEMCYVACGRGDIYLSTNTDTYADVAGTLVVQEAGGKVWQSDNGTSVAKIYAANSLLYSILEKLAIADGAAQELAGASGDDLTPIS